MTLLEVRDLNVWYSLDEGGENHAVRDLSFTLDRGERMGLVGESGCGKTTALLALMALLPPSASVSGQVLLDGQDLLAGGEAIARQHRWRDLALVFQGAMNAFNPVRRIEDQIIEPMLTHGTRTSDSARDRARELLEMVGITAAAGRRFPHELSGGMRQRAMLAMALACEPRVLIADEPTTALDTMVQAQILALLTRLSDELGLAVLLVTHDLPVVSQVCSRAVVMYAGGLAEAGPVADLFHRPAHPYTRLLFEATPDLHSDREVVSIPGAPPRLDEPIVGCSFRPRCDVPLEICSARAPRPLSVADNPGHVAACWHNGGAR